MEGPGAVGVASGRVDPAGAEAWRPERDQPEGVPPVSGPGAVASVAPGRPTRVPPGVGVAVCVVAVPEPPPGGAGVALDDLHDLLLEGVQAPLDFGQRHVLQVPPELGNLRPQRVEPGHAVRRSAVRPG